MAVGVAAGMLVAGLGFPFVFGTADSNQVSSGGVNLQGLPPQASGGSTSGSSLGSAGGAPTTINGSGLNGPSPLNGSPAPSVSGEGGGTVPTGSAGYTSSVSVPGAPTGSGPSPGTQLTSSDRGVTPTTIKLGITILDLGGVGRLGVSLPGYQPAHQEAIWSGYINALNKQGGILGRKVVPVFQTYDITSTDSMQAACVALTQDQKVFAVLDTSGFTGAPVLCLTQQNQTPFLTVGELGTPNSFYAESAGRLFTLHASGDRQMANMAAVLSQRNALNGKTIGILGQQGLGFAEVYSTLQAALKKYGHPSVYEYDLSSDTGTAASQIPIAVNEMQAHGVNAVFLLSNLVINGEFVDQAQSETYSPAYFTSDWGTGENMSSSAASFNGALAVTETDAFDWNEGLPQPTYDAQCQQRGTADSGYTWDPSNSASINHPADIRDCSMVDLFTWAAGRAGANLTRTGLVEALEHLGRVPVATFPPSGSFSTTKHDAADYVRIDQYQSSRNCGSASSSPGCFYPITPFQLSPY